MIFISNGNHYHVDPAGAIHQSDAVPFVYDEKYVSVYDTPKYKKQSRRLQSIRVAFVKASHGSRVESLLDYGYGNGDFLKIAAKRFELVRGFDITGIEVEGIQTSTILDSDVDVITFWDSLEHVADLTFLKDLQCQTVVISLPFCHFHDRGKEWFDTNYRHRKPNEHLHHFDEKSLSATMKIYGWRAVATSVRGFSGGIKRFASEEDIIRTNGKDIENILTMGFKR